MSRDAGGRNQGENTLKLPYILFFAEIFIELCDAIRMFRIHHDDVQKLLVARFAKSLYILCGGVIEVFQKILSIILNQIQSIGIINLTYFRKAFLYVFKLIRL